MSNNNSFNLLKKQLLSPTNNAIIHNRFVLYFILFIALANLYFLTMSGDLVFTSIFVLVGFLTSFFSKNMLVILFIALTITNILKYGSAIKQEGFEDADEIDSHTQNNDEHHDDEIHLTKDDSEDEDKKIKPDKYKKNKIKKGNPIEINPADIAEKLKKIVTIMKS
jgi:hypothetical protein